MFFDILKAAFYWPIPNYTNPEKRGDENWYVTGIFLFGATVCVALRLYTRVFVRRWFGIDDILILASWLCSIMLTALIGLGTEKYGWNIHIWDLPPALYSEAAHVLYVSQLAWGTATSLVRLSVLVLYYRLLNAAGAPRSYYIVNHVVLASTLLLWLYYLVSQTFTCWPVSAFWSYPDKVQPVCMDAGMSLTVSGGVNTASEFVVASLPAIAVWKLGVEKSQRKAVIGVLCLGYAIVLVGALRTYYLFKIFEKYDLTWWAGPQWICTEVELDTAIMCACAAPLRPIIGRWIRKLRGGRVVLPEKPVRSWFSSQISKSSATTGMKNSQVSSQSRSSLDHATMAEWRAAMSRTIDLEGIAIDGLGYSIKISGPSKFDKQQERIKMNMVKAGILSIGGQRHNKHRKVDVESARAESSYGIKEISAHTEVNVRESFHSDMHNAWGLTPAEREQHMMSSRFEDDGIDFETSALATTQLQNDDEWSLGRPTTPGRSHHVRDLSKNPTFFESVESLEALPTIPGRPEQTYIEEPQRYRSSPFGRQTTRRE